MALIKTENNFFIFLVGFAATLVAISAAVFSVIGIAMLYSRYIAIAMAILEFSKIIIVSLLYRHWHELTILLKGYLTTALILLMLITSGGIYGYFTNSYQNTTIGLDKINSQILILDQRKENYINEYTRLVEDIAILRNERQSTITNRNNEISVNNITTDSISTKFRSWRNTQVYKRYNTELILIDNNITKYVINLDSINTKLSRTNDALADSKLAMIETGIEVGPLVYMARLLNTTMDTVMKWFTLVIVLVFDPLAIALVLALNIIIKLREQRQTNNVIHKKEKNDDKSVDVEENDKPVEKDKPVDVEEKEKKEHRFNLTNLPKTQEKPIDKNNEIEKKNEIDNEIEEDDDEEIGFEDDLIIEALKEETKVPATENEITEYFETAAKKLKKENIGKISHVTFESGGSVNIDYSIQE